MLSLKAFCQPNPQFLLSSFTSFNYILTSICFPTHRRLLRLSPKTNIFYFQLLAFVAILSTCATHSSYILHFFCPILLLSFFFPPKKSTSNYPLSLSLTLILPLAQTALLSSWISAFASMSSHSIACPLLISHQSPLPSFLASLPPPFFRCLHLFSNSLFFPPGS